MSVTCEYERQGALFRCKLCGDETDVEGLRRGCPSRKRKSKPRRNATLEKTRLEICSNCPLEAGEYRCREIDAGCSRTFRRRLKDPDYPCPRDKWKTAMAKKWSYGVTTVPSRVDDGLLRRTLKSLAAGGFTAPRIFVDGELPNKPFWLKKYRVVERLETVRTFGNWILTAWELYLREPQAELFAIFQDDLVTVKNLRKYLESVHYPPNGYLNLYTFPQNEKDIDGFYLSNQKGKGAVALVFSNEAIRTILKSEHMINRPLNPKRGWKAVDGGIVTGFKKAGWKEYVHKPSLVQHTGKVSSMGNNEHQQARTFPGEGFDATRLIDGIPEVEDYPKEKIGLVGYSCANGLGELNRQIANHIDIAAWLIKPHGKHKLVRPEKKRTMKIVLPSSNQDKKVNQFLDMVDVVLFCETEYFPGLIKKAKEKGKRIVCVPMLEWTPTNGWVKDIDQFLCPTEQCYEALKKEGLPCTWFSWPFDTSHFQFQQRDVCRRFLFINGHGGVAGRKGAQVVREAKKLWPAMPLLVRSQKQEEWPEGTEVLDSVSDNSQLYNEGDVLLAPHSIDGIGLELTEAMACGMPVIATDHEPWNKHLLLDTIPTQVSPRMVRRKMPWCNPDPKGLVEVCKQWLEANITEQSRDARRYADSNRWQGRIELFTKLVRVGGNEIALPFLPEGVEA